MNDKRAILRRSAKADMARHFRWLEREAGTEIAERFLAAADSTFGDLAINPGLGAAARSHSPRLDRLRKWRIAGFPKLLVFYVPHDQGIDILRVVHASADWQGLLDVD